MRRRKTFVLTTEKERQRMKNRRFLIGFLIFFLVFGTFSVLYLLRGYDFDLSRLIDVRDEKTSEASERGTELSFSDSEAYVLLYCTDIEGAEMRFISLVKIDLEGRAFTVCSLSPNERVGLRGESPETLMEHYRRGGAKRLMSAVAEFSSVKISRYAASDDNGFKKAVNLAGLLTLNVESRISYRTEDFTFILPAGQQRLRGDDLLRYMRYCAATGDAGLGKQSEAIGQMLVQYINERNLQSGENLFSSVRNLLSSDITIMDFIGCKDMLTYITQNAFSVHTVAYIN
ncbi:MAG: LCP family protein [Oscillospiraceae bacterium]|nr:LCP family protein [Oscillospiraceae bacterium]